MSEETKDKGNTKELIDNLKKEIEDSKKDLISAELQQKIENERKQAREEALKEVEKENLMREKEAEIEKLKKEAEEKQRLNEQKLRELTEKVDDMQSSKAVYPQGQTLAQQNPLNNQNNDPTKVDVMKMSDDEYKDLERQSMELFLEQKLSRR